MFFEIRIRQSNVFEFEFELKNQSVRAKQKQKPKGFGFFEQRRKRQLSTGKRWIITKHLDLVSMNKTPCLSVWLEIILLGSIYVLFVCCKFTVFTLSFQIYLEINFVCFAMQYIHNDGLFVWWFVFVKIGVKFKVSSLLLGRTL